MNKLPEIKIAYEDYKYLLKQLKEKLNIDFANYTTAILKRRIESFYTTYNYLSFPKFVERLITNRLTLEKFLSDVLVPTTEMFRDPEVWNLLKNKFLDYLIEKFGNIKIWIPDITSDDELFSLIIILDHLNLTEQATIVATSPFEAVLKKFENDIPVIPKKFEHSLQNIKEGQLKIDLQKYFVKTESDYIFKRIYFQNVKFQKFDFSSDEPFDQFHLILYRNRMLYYNLKMYNLALDKIYESLENGGLLIIGYRECLRIWSNFDKFKTVAKDEQIFKKLK